MIRWSFLLALVAVMSCGVRETTTRMDLKNNNATCVSREQLIERIGQAVISGETASLRTLTASADDLLLLQGEGPAAWKSENRAALTRQMADDVVTAINRFRTDMKPSRVVRSTAGELREHSPIENIAPSADQVRAAQIIFDTPAGEKSLTIGVLVRVDRCWKILYI